MQFNSALKRVVFLVTVAACTFPAWAQWQWIGKDGRKVFSDQSPPADIKDKDILKRPGGRPAPSVQAAPAVAPIATASTAAPKLSGKESELETRKKQVEKDDVSKKKAEDEQQAKLRDDNCAQAKSAMTTLQSGVRIGVTNAAGEREVMDDAKRAIETQRVKDAVATNCKK